MRGVESGTHRWNAGGLEGAEEERWFRKRPPSAESGAERPNDEDEESALSRKVYAELFPDAGHDLFQQCGTDM